MKAKPGTGGSGEERYLCKGLLKEILRIRAERKSIAVFFAEGPLPCWKYRIYPAIRGSSVLISGMTREKRIVLSDLSGREMVDI